MKRFILMLTLSLFVIGGSNICYADKHSGKHGNHKEYREQGARPGHKDHGKIDHGITNDRYGRPMLDYRKHNDHNYDKARKEAEKYRKQRDRHARRHAIERERRFHNMVAKAARGGSDIMVWRVSDDTYIVKYRKGRNWYTRRFNPYSGHMYSPGLISLNWNPLSSWTLLPSININIGL